MTTPICLLSLSIESTRPALGLEIFDLGEGRSVTGSLVKENSETLFLDLGYTILEVPRKEIVARSVVGEAKADAGGAGKGSAQAVEGQLYTHGEFAKASVRTCTERVESGVVLVKVPGALCRGSWCTRTDGS
jgi:serine protease Do